MRPGEGAPAACLTHLTPAPRTPPAMAPPMTSRGISGPPSPRPTHIPYTHARHTDGITGPPSRPRNIPPQAIGATQQPRPLQSPLLWGNYNVAYTSTSRSVDQQGQREDGRRDSLFVCCWCARAMCMCLLTLCACVPTELR